MTSPIICPKRGLDGRIGKGAEAEDELVEEYLALESHVPGSRCRQGPVIVIPGDERCAALSGSFAMDASRRAEVTDFFRQKHLKAGCWGR